MRLNSCSSHFSRVQRRTHGRIPSREGGKNFGVRAFQLSDWREYVPAARGLLSGPGHHREPAHPESVAFSASFPPLPVSSPVSPSVSLRCYLSSFPLYHLKSFPSSVLCPWVSKWPPQLASMGRKPYLSLRSDTFSIGTERVL